MKDSQRGIWRQCQTISFTRQQRFGKMHGAFAPSTRPSPSISAECTENALKPARKFAENVGEATAGAGSTRHMVEPALLKRPSGQALHKLRPPDAAPKVFLGQAAHVMELVPTENLPGGYDRRHLCQWGGGRVGTRSRDGHSDSSWRI
jgi:hypothetical protein